MALPYTGAVEGSLWFFCLGTTMAPLGLPAMQHCFPGLRSYWISKFSIITLFPCRHMRNSQGIRGLEMVSAKINPLLCDFLWGRG